MVTKDSGNGSKALLWAQTLEKNMSPGEGFILSEPREEGYGMIQASPFVCLRISLQRTPCTEEEKEEEEEEKEEEHGRETEKQKQKHHPVLKNVF